MKKLLVILCLCSLLLAFAGCSGTAPVATETSTATQETTPESTAETTTETTSETTAKPTPTPIVTKGDTIEYVGLADDIVIRGDKMQISDRYSINPALLPDSLIYVPRSKTATIQLPIEDLPEFEITYVTDYGTDGSQPFLTGKTSFSFKGLPGRVIHTVVKSVDLEVTVFEIVGDRVFLNLFFDIYKEDGVNQQLFDAAIYCLTDNSVCFLSGQQDITCRYAEIPLRPDWAEHTAGEFIAFSPDRSKVVYRVEPRVESWVGSYFVYDVEEKTSTLLFDRSCGGYAVYSYDEEYVIWADNQTVYILPTIRYWGTGKVEDFLVCCRFANGEWQMQELPYDIQQNNPDQDFPVYDFPTYAGTYKIYIENGKAVFENLFTEERFSSSDPVVCAAIQDRSFSALEYGNIQFNASGTACALAYRQDLVLLDFAKRTIEHRHRLYDVTVRWAGDDFLCTFFDDSVDILRYLKVPAAEPVEWEDPVKEYHPITNDAGKYTGVVFTLSDGSTYTWTCPAESLLSIVPPVATSYSSSSSVYTIDYYIGNGEWLFDRVNVLEHKILYRHKNDKGFRYTFGTSGRQQENGYIRISADGKAKYDRVPWEKYDYSFFQTNTLTAIREVIPLHPGDTLPQKAAYSHVFTTIPTNWVYDKTDFMYYEKNFPEHSDYSYVRRMSGLDVLYYSEEPIEDLSAELAKELFPETLEIRANDVRLYNSYDGHSKIHFARYDGDDDYWADDPKGIDTELDEKYVAIVQLDAHYFAKVEVYLIDIDDQHDDPLINPIRNLMYFNE